jgi:hypothetical protein
MRLSRTLTLVAVVAFVAAVGALAAHALPREGLLYLGSGARSPPSRPARARCASPRRPRSQRATGHGCTDAVDQLRNPADDVGRAAARRSRHASSPRTSGCAVSDDGRAVVLTKGVTGANPYVAQPRTTTS